MYMVLSVISSVLTVGNDDRDGEMMMSDDQAVWMLVKVDMFFSSQVNFSVQRIFHSLNSAYFVGESCWMLGLFWFLGLDSTAV